MREFFYRPEGAWAADFIPFYSHGRYHLFYLLDWRDAANHGEGTPWYQISTRDFVHFEEHGEMLARGTAEEQDLYVFTGSVVEGPGAYHIFYTGHNHHLAPKPIQGVMHAVSNDLLHWRKVAGEIMFAPAPDFEPNDWRDPFVFFNPEAGEYWMLLAARLTSGPSRRRGCTALCTSTDLTHWQVRPPLYAPGLYFTHECPDLFRIGDWWYLLFSEFSEGCLTRYRMARSLQGPWLTPADDAFDGRALYAAKTAGDGRRRYLFGWHATREGGKDYKGWQWGGNLVVHELWQRADGTLAVRPPESVLQAFSREVPFDVQPGVGACTLAEGGVTLAAAGTFAGVLAGAMPARCAIEATVTPLAADGTCGLILRSSDDLEQGYYVRLDPAHGLLTFDSWPRPGDVPYMLEVSRPLAMAPGQPVHLTVLVDGSVCEVYANGEVAMSVRMYDHPTGQWGLYAQQGEARFEGLSLRTTE